MEKEISNPSSVQLSAPAHFQLKRIASFTNLTQAQICEDFIGKLYLALQGYMLKAMVTGDRITYSIDIHAGIGIEMVSGTFAVPMDMPNSETDEIRDQLIAEQFSILDKQKEERRKAFAENRCV